jgi:hypothetical protein
MVNLCRSTLEEYDEVTDRLHAAKLESTQLNNKIANLTVGLCTS